MRGIPTACLLAFVACNSSAPTAPMPVPSPGFPATGIPPALPGMPVPGVPVPGVPVPGVPAPGVPAPATAVPGVVEASDAPALPLAVGQWVRFQQTQEGRNQILELSYKCVGQENGAYWFEVDNVTQQGNVTFKMLLAMPDRGNVETLEIRRVILRQPNGRIMEFTPAMLRMGRAMMGSMLHNLVANWAGLPREDVTVAAGTYRQCFRREEDVNFMGQRLHVQSWHHPSVPINGIVKQVASNGSTLELAAFGATGATSVFPP